MFLTFVFVPIVISQEIEKFYKINMVDNSEAKYFDSSQIDFLK